MWRIATPGKNVKPDDSVGTYLYTWGLLGSSLPGAYSAEKQPLGDRSQAHSCRTLPARGKRPPRCSGCAYHAGSLEVADILGKENHVLLVV